jgi:hypothetical protein
MWTDKRGMSRLKMRLNLMSTWASQERLENFEASTALRYQSSVALIRVTLPGFTKSTMVAIRAATGLRLGQ